MKPRKNERPGKVGGTAGPFKKRAMKLDFVAHYTTPVHLEQAALGELIDQELDSVDRHETAFWQYVRLAAEHRHQLHLAQDRLRELERLIPTSTRRAA